MDYIKIYPLGRIKAGAPLVNINVYCIRIDLFVILWLVLAFVKIDKGEIMRNLLKIHHDSDPPRSRTSKISIEG